MAATHAVTTGIVAVTATEIEIVTVTETVTETATATGIVTETGIAIATAMIPDLNPDLIQDLFMIGKPAVVKRTEITKRRAVDCVFTALFMVDEQRIRC